MSGCNFVTNVPRSHFIFSVAHYRSLIQLDDGLSDCRDFGNLVNLLLNDEQITEAKDIVIKGLVTFHTKRDYFVQLSRQIIEITGDREFRHQIEAMSVGESQ